VSPRALSADLSSGPLKYFVLGEGRPLLYLHSSAGVSWTAVLEGLAKSHAVHVPVIPGYDGTPRHATVDDMPAVGRLLGEFLDKQFGKPVDVIGHSFGGRAALWLALERPDIVDHLVLEAPSGFARNGTFPTDPDTLRARMFAYPEKRPPFERSPQRAGQLAGNRKTTEAYLKGASFDAALQDRVSSVKQMTLLLHGTSDVICPKEGLQALKAKLPRGFLVYIWDAAHAIEVDQPERMLTVTEAFLRHSEAFVVNWGSGATISAAS
jgi:pimeloyl-ACP methyl ester carboxylesterase